MVKEQAASQARPGRSLGPTRRGTTSGGSQDGADADQTHRTQIALATAELEAARASLRLAELNLGYTDIRAPVAGRIAESNAFVGCPGDKTRPRL